MMRLGTLTRRKRRNSQRGVTMIEVLFAGVVLTVGMLGYAALTATAIAVNARSRTDSTSAMLTQTVMEEISASLQGATTAIRDCGGNSFTVNTATSATSIVDSSDNINWSTTPASGYHMDYEICASSNNTTTNMQYRIYDVRWNIAQVAGTQTYFVVVGARPKNYQANNLRDFTLPVQMKYYVTGAAH